MNFLKRLTTLVPVVLILACAPAAFAEPGELEPGEAGALEFSLLFEELKQDYFENMSEHWQSPFFAELAADEQYYFDALNTLAAQYDLPVSDSYWGCNIVFWAVAELDFYCGLMNMEWPWWDEWEEALSVGAYFEELVIHKLRQAVAGTDEAVLIDTYTEMLGASYQHLLRFAQKLYVHPLDYRAQILTQGAVDAVLIEAIAANTADFEINPGLNDAWYEPESNGQGFFLTVYPEQESVFLGWFTYDMAFPGQDAIAELGDPCQRWLTAQGPFSGSQAELVLYNAKGGLFDKALPEPELEPIGSILLQFENCESGMVSYEMPELGLSGVIPIRRLAPDNVAACEARAFMAD